MKQHSGLRQVDVLADMAKRLVFREKTLQHGPGQCRDRFRYHVKPSWGCRSASAITRRWNARCRSSRSTVSNVLANFQSGFEGKSAKFQPFQRKKSMSWRISSMTARNRPSLPP